MTQFDFYLINLSFRSPKNTTIENLRKKIEQLSDDCEFIREHDDKIYRHISIYDETLWENHTVSELCHTTELEKELGRDYQFMLKTIIDNSTYTSWNEGEILELIYAHEKELVSGLLCLFEVANFPQEYCIYDKNDWYTFHRYFLGVYPISEIHFTEKCQIYFANLYFHQNIIRTLGTLDGGFKVFAKTITKCLSYLNDELKNHYNPSNIPDSLKRFSSACGVTTTNEGNISRKGDLTFNFFDNNGNEENLYCEPHMKLSKSDNQGDSKHYHNRLYFHLGKDNIANGRILIGYIGVHL